MYRDSLLRGAVAQCCSGLLASGTGETLYKIIDNNKDSHSYRTDMSNITLLMLDKINKPLYLLRRGRAVFGRVRFSLLCTVDGGAALSVSAPLPAPIYKLQLNK